MAPVVPFPRPLYPPSHPKGPSVDGDDVIAIKRAISRAGFFPWRKFDDSYNETFAMEGVKEFQKHHDLTPTGYYGENTHEKLRLARRKNVANEWAFDATAINLMKEAKKDLEKAAVKPELKKAREILDFCRLFNGRYVYGGQHDVSLSDDSIHDGFDCSSSTSLALWKFGLLGSNQAQVSGWFKSWGEPGRGKYITVHAANDHVWIEFTLPEGYFRFDTSPYGDGGAGPRVRVRWRPDSGFVARHPKGL